MKTQNIDVGTKVTWTSQAQGSARTKTGIVVAVVPPNEHPLLFAPKGSKVDASGMPRPKESYLVKVEGRKALYWPHASRLKVVEQSKPFAPEEYVGHVFTDLDGKQWSVEKAFKAHVRAKSIDVGSYGKKRSVLFDELKTWRKHTLPKLLKIGDALIYNGDPVKVRAFYPQYVRAFYPQYGRGMVGLVGRWGFEKGHSHENLIPVNHITTHQGFRLPFPGEKITEEGAK